MRLPVAVLAALPLLAACQDLAPSAAPTGARAPSPADVATASIPPFAGSRSYLCSDGTVVRAYDRNRTSGTSAVTAALDIGMMTRGSLVLDIGGERVRMLPGASANGTRYIGGGYEWTTNGLQLATLAPVGPDGVAAGGVACRSNG